MQIEAELAPTTGQRLDASAHRERHAQRAGLRIGHGHRVVEEHHHAVAGEALEGALVREDDLAHGRVILPQHAHDLLRLGGLGERGKATQVEEDDDDLAPVALERIVGATVDDRLGERGREEALEPR